MSYDSVLVTDLKGAKALAVRCTSCGNIFDCRDADHHCEAIDSHPCPACGHWGLIPAYEQGVKCGGCLKMMPEWDVPLPDYGGCCSRRCALQAEYRDRLDDSRRTPAAESQPYPVDPGASGGVGS